LVATIASATSQRTGYPAQHPGVWLKYYSFSDSCQYFIRIVFKRFQPLFRIQACLVYRSAQTLQLLIQLIDRLGKRVKIDGVIYPLCIDYVTAK
jgi:hypothetical protein